MSHLSIIRKFFTMDLMTPSLMSQHFMNVNDIEVLFKRSTTSTYLYVSSHRDGTIILMPLLDWEDNKLTAANSTPQEVDTKELLNEEIDDIYLILKYGPEIKDQSILDLIEYQAKNPTSEGFNYVTDLT